jgi:hypothetical protein
MTWDPETVLLEVEKRCAQNGLLKDALILTSSRFKVWWHYKMTLGKDLTEIKVPGKMDMVSTAMVIIEELSRSVCCATLAVRPAILVFVRFSNCIARWKSCGSVRTRN